MSAKCVCGCKELYHFHKYPHVCFNSPACGCKAWQTPKVDRTLRLEECK